MSREAHGFPSDKRRPKPLSEEQKRWAIEDYEDGYVRWKDMDDATMSVVEDEHWRRRQKRKARGKEAAQKEWEARV